MTPAALVRSVLSDLLNDTLLADLGATFARVLLGATLSLVLGGSLGLLLGASPRLHRATGPVVDGIRSIPPVLVYPLLLLALGYGEGSRLAAIVFGAMGVVVVPVARSLLETPTARRDIVRLARLPPLATLWHLHLPQAAGALVTAARLALAQALVVAVVTEMLVSPAHGLGVRALGALQEYRSDRLWQVILLAGGASAGLNAALGALDRRVRGADGARPREVEPGE